MKKADLHNANLLKMVDLKRFEKHNSIFLNFYYSIKCKYAHKVVILMTFCTYCSGYYHSDCCQIAVIFVNESAR